MGKWLPIARAVLSAAVRQLPSPSRAQQWRLERLWLPNYSNNLQLDDFQARVQRALLECSRHPDAPVVAYVCKVFNAARSDRQPANSRDERLVAVTRLFCGTLRVGDQVHILGPRYDPARPNEHRALAVVPQLYLLMGPELVPIEFAEAGSIFGIAAAGMASGRWRSRVHLVSSRPARGEMQAKRGEDVNGGKIDINQPRIDTNQPRIDTNQPRIDTNHPKIDTNQPRIDTNHPKIDTNQPQVDINHPKIDAIGGDNLETGRDDTETGENKESDMERASFVSHIVKTATLCSQASIRPFGPLLRHVNPIVRVAVEPKHACDLRQLELGLSLLHRADASTEVYVQANGEHLIGALGELHLKHSLELLREEFARVEIKVSPPVVSYRETVTWELAREEVRLEALRGARLWGVELEWAAKWADKYRFCVPAMSSGGQVRAVVRAVPLPPRLSQWLEEHEYETKAVQKIYRWRTNRRRRAESEKTVDDQLDSEASNLASGETETVARWSRELRHELAACCASWEQQADFIWALGPPRRSANVLLNNVPGYAAGTPWRGLLSFGDAPSDPENAPRYAQLSQLEETVLSVFQMTIKSGTLCEEPMTGVAFQLLELEVLTEDDERGSTEVDALKSRGGSVSGSSPVSGSSSSPVSGSARNVALVYGALPAPGHSASVDSSALASLLSRPMCSAASTSSSSARHLSSAFSLLSAQFRVAFSCRCRRLCEALYLAHVQVAVASLNKLHAVLSRRRGHVVSDRICEGTDTAIAEAYLPAAEAFGFAEELTARTGGSATAQLTFSHWSVLDSDPDFVPTTEDELEEHGGNLGGLSSNLAKTCVDLIRKRKGLFVKQKLVEHANKQRTRSRKK